MIKFKIIKGEEGYLHSKDFRYSVLVDEMGLFDQFEDADKIAYHVIGREDGEVICSARFYKTGDYVGTIDKICVKKEDRMQYVADTMIRALEDKAVSEITAVIVSQVSEGAWEFFEHEDYIVIDEYEENGIKYKKMKRDLSKVRGCRGGCHK